MWPLTEPIEDFFRDQFLGPQLGTYYGYPVYHPDPAAFYQSLTPEEYDSFNDAIATDSETWTHSLNFRLTNTNLFEMPAGTVGWRCWPRSGSSPGRTRRIRASSPASSGASPEPRARASAKTGRRHSSSACRSSAC